MQTNAYSDIYCDEETNQTLKTLRTALENRDTNKVINFIKDNNLSADVRMVNDETPLMYSSYFNDTNTTKALIELGVDVSLKDNFGFNALARTMEYNAFNTAKILLENGADVNSSKYIIGWELKDKSYNYIKSISIDKDFNIL